MEEKDGKEVREGRRAGEGQREKEREREREMWWNERETRKKSRNPSPISLTFVRN